VFRPAGRSEASALSQHLDPAANDSTIYVLADVTVRPPGSPLAAVAVGIRDGTWVIRSVHTRDDPVISNRLGRDLRAEAVRSGATALVVPPESSAGCRALLAGCSPVEQRADWLIHEL
jgi:hypothetical protein